MRRCKERRRLMKEAVYARHHLAAAHADYCRSLRITGASLADFAAGEPLSVSDQTPAVLLRNPSSVSNSAYQPPPRVPSPAPSLRPPAPAFSPSPSPTIASSKMPHILSASSLNSYRRRKPPKLPHILSESSLSSSPVSQLSDGKFHNPTAYQANSTYSSTPSQASSVWNWENFYPPSPPDSEFFRRPTNHDKHSEHTQRHHLDDDGDETEREEVQCSEWGDHYSTTSSSDEEDVESRSEIGNRSNFGSSVHNEPTTVKSKFPPATKSDKSDDAGSSVSYGAGTVESSDLKMVVRHRDLSEIVASLKEYFDKAASAGEHASEMLETGRAQLDRSFRQLKSMYNLNLHFKI